MKKPNRSLAVLLVAGVAVLTLAAVLVARPRHEGPGAKGPLAERFVEHRFDRLAEYLELSQDQSAGAKALRDRWFGDARERHEAIAATFETVHERVSAESPDATAIGELVIQMHREREAMKAAHEGYRSELVELLTPEQAEKLEAWEAARSWGGDCGPHRWRGGHHGVRFHSPDTD